MNYLRGAVSAISAPYQYYKDINPSTLTGAIDVIVISRPKLDNAQDGDSEHKPAPDAEREYACSPFHVRFGKWQVLRPADKKVDVFVNGNLIPFSMKIGDAGEAFFVFETDEDISEDIATSPLLEATKPGQANNQDQPTGRFGAKTDGTESPAEGIQQEPEFLDLNASSQEEASLPDSASPASDGNVPKISTKDHPAEESNKSIGPSSLFARTAEIGKAALGLAHEAEVAGKDKLKDHTMKEAIKEVHDEEHGYVMDKIKAARDFSPTRYVSGIGSEKGDEVLPEVTQDADAPEVHYGHDMVFDTAGYHSQGHVQERSDETVTRLSRSPSPTSSDEDSTPGPSRSPSPELGPIPFPRATSEPPPDIEDTHPMKPLTSSTRYGTQARRKLAPNIASSEHPSSLKLTMPETEEYSWEWGNFPQKTPVWTAFNHAQRPSADLKGKGRMLPNEDADADYWSQDRSSAEDFRSGYGSGGFLTVDKRDPSRFRVFIEGRTVEFELSILPTLEGSRTRNHSGRLGGRDAVEDAEIFEKGKIDFNTFLQDEGAVKSDQLVLCWAGDKYITRSDGSPLMDALVLWREAAITKGHQVSSRPVSPIAEEDRQLGLPATRTQETLSSGPASDAPSRPSSWVRWWSRSRRSDAVRPELRPVSSAPSEVDAARLRDKEQITELPLPSIRPGAAKSPSTESAPVVSRSFEGTPVKADPPVSMTDGNKPTRFAKTLRLTSEQLKSLELKSGANTITFSLSSTGVAACTARIFVWDYTDSIVVSDIDGTITKSDALGHVFTMIGRDWTHLGVAKLYTDICRNGYKIMYLTSRAIGQADSTRDYLRGIKQNDYQLPEGPVVMSPDRLMASLHREVIMRKPEVFKMACLRDIQRLFGPSARNPFYAGFGNRITDALSYRSVNVPSSRIFTIDSTGEVKMELLELAGYKSSYIHMTDLVDQMFPPINRKWASEYTDFNYWKTPVMDFPLPDLSPPSPALSARSDTSNQSTLARLRHFSLGGRQATNSSRFSLPPPATAEGQKARDEKAEADRKEAHLRQMSSFERLTSTLASFRSSTSVASSPGTLTPTSADGSESEGEEDGDDLEKGRRRRRRSISSMPGSMPGNSDDEMHFDEDEDADEDMEEGHPFEGQTEEEAAARDFDETCFAVGEMENVPFL